MNYIVNEWSGTIFFLFMLVMLGFFIFFYRILFLVEKKLLLSESKKGILIASYFIFFLFFVIYSYGLFLELFNRGKIIQVYSIKEQGKDILSILSREDSHGKGMSIYTYYLLNYDAGSAKKLKEIRLASMKDNYRIFERNGNYIWLHSKTTGLQLLDLGKAIITAEEKRLYQKTQTYNPLFILTQLILMTSRTAIFKL